MGRVSAGMPADDCGGSWAVCSPEAVGRFTATGYFFGRELHKRLDLPIGLLNSSVGGTPIEAWTNRRGLAPGQPVPKGPDPDSPEVRQARADYAIQLERWKAKLATTKDRRERRRIRRPRPPKALAELYAHNGNLYNGMIHPLLGYGIRGAIWYQGEANAGRGFAYRKKLPAMIQGWREVWGQGDFPFGVVQLPNFRRRADQPTDGSWAVVRESQALAMKLPNTGLAVTIDIGEAGNIHPRNKRDVGRRLALWALAKAYGKEVVHAGPVYEKMEIAGSKVSVHFRDESGGLLAKGGELKGFAVAGEDRKWVWARAEIDGSAVVVHSDEVPKPVAVRYAWANNPECNLYNKAGLPAGPFRTDTWPVVTQPKANPTK